MIRPGIRRLFRLPVRRGAPVAADLDDEIRLHLELRAEQLEKRGMPAAAARAEALRRFGAMDEARGGLYRAAQRREWSMRAREWLETVGQDARYALRTLRSNPGFAAVAVLTLALGVGANTAFFSVIDGVLLRPLPFREAERLVVVWETDRHSGTTREPAAWPDYLDFARRSTTVRDMAVLLGMEVNLTPATGEPARLSAVASSAGYFGLVGVRPLLGRGFTPEEDRPGGARTVVLGEAFWRARFRGDPGVIGRTIRLDDKAYTVVGVVPAGADVGVDQIHEQAAYHAPYTGAGDVDVWVPLQAGEADYPRDTHPFFIVGRLAPGAGVEAAQAELGRIGAEVERTYPSNDGRGVHVEALERVVFGPVRPALLVLWGAVALVLLVACVNVANLLLARGAARAREVAVRTAVGAGLDRLGRQFLVESVVLALLGGLAGIALAWALLRALLVLAPADVPRLGEVGLDGRVLAMTLAVSLAVGIAFGLVPLAQARWVDVARTLRSEGGRGATGGRARRRVRQALVVAELALSVALVVGAGLLIRSFWTVLRSDPGFRAEGVLKAQFELPQSRYPQDFKVWPAWKEVHALHATVLERARALPGVRSAALAAVHPLDAGFTNSWSVVGREAESGDWPEISVRQVTPGYFPTLGIRLLRGRLLEESDDAAAPGVGVINETAAKRFFAGRDPLGQVIQIWGRVRWRIVGVIADERIHGVTEAAPPALYLPFAQAPGASGVLLVRTAGDPARLANPLRRAIWAVDPGLAVYGVEPLQATLVASVAQRRFTMLVLGAFAAVALLLALVGVHGVLSYTVSQRGAEMGIRMALGATRRDVVALVLRGGIGLALLGTALGIVAALAGTRLLASLLYGVGTLDPLTFLAVPAAVLAAAALASWLPARRATKADPVVALRAE